jgi:hypothetical protein
MGLWVRMLELNVTRRYDEKGIAEAIEKVEWMSVPSLQHQGPKVNYLYTAAA